MIGCMLVISWILAIQIYIYGAKDQFYLEDDCVLLCDFQRRFMCNVISNVYNNLLLNKPSNVTTYDVVYWMHDAINISCVMWHNAPEGW